MTRRNVWLSFSEWELISNELSNQPYNQFELYDREVKEWKEQIKCYIEEGWNLEGSKHCFERVGIYPAIERVKSAKAINVLCRENWRSQDIYNVMRYPHDFIGFIVNYVDDVDMNTSFEEWERIRVEMKNEMDKTDKRLWSYDDIIDLYKEVVSFPQVL
jgi:hypothetical protein